MRACVSLCLAVPLHPGKRHRHRHRHRLKQPQVNTSQDGQKARGWAIKHSRQVARCREPRQKSLQVSRRWLNTPWLPLVEVERRRAAWISKVTCSSLIVGRCVSPVAGVRRVAGDAGVLQVCSRRLDVRFVSQGGDQGDGSTRIVWRAMAAISYCTEFLRRPKLMVLALDIGRANKFLHNCTPERHGFCTCSPRSTSLMIETLTDLATSLVDGVVGSIFSFHLLRP